MTTNKCWKDFAHIQYVVHVCTGLALFSGSTAQSSHYHNEADNILTFPPGLQSHIIQDHTLIIVLWLAGCYSNSSTNRTLRQMWLFDGKHLTLQREGELWQPASYRNSFINPRHKELSQFVTLFDGKVLWMCCADQKKIAVNSLQSYQGHVWGELALNCKKKS